MEVKYCPSSTPNISVVPIISGQLTSLWGISLPLHLILKYPSPISLCQHYPHPPLFFSNESVSFSFIKVWLSFCPYTRINNSTIGGFFYFAYYCFSQTLVQSILWGLNKHLPSKILRMDYREYKRQKKWNGKLISFKYLNIYSNWNRSSMRTGIFTTFAECKNG